MRLHIGMNADRWGEILNSLHKVARGDENISMDLNVIGKNDDRALIYVRNYDTLQVIHSIENSDSAIVEVNEPTKLVFDSQVLHTVVQRAGDRELDLRFGEHEFEVEIGQETFSSATEFNLRLVQDSEFQEPLNIQGYEEIVEVNRTELLQNLKMLLSISKVVNFSTEGDELTISVSDKVQGSGELQIGIDNGLIDVEASYPIRPIRDFLDKMKSDTVKIFMTPKKTIKIQSASTGRISSIQRAERL
mgnify:CR=1 FL=1